MCIDNTTCYVDKLRVFSHTLGSKRYSCCFTEGSGHKANKKSQKNISKLSLTMYIFTFMPASSCKQNQHVEDDTEVKPY